ncbi:hypothetical protein ATCC90586_000728 [Pythium insidiosum]|nr:hypothetical protein ATCC90586_000728 [Pythium insidiosum]
MALSASPTEQTLYHVRLIDPWIPSDASASSSLSSSSSPSPGPAPFSFFGLDLELRGHHSDGSPVAIALSFPDDAQQRAELDTVGGPFEIVVKAKVAPDKVTPPQRVVVQPPHHQQRSRAMLKVQAHNRLARINKIHFLKAAATARDVQRALLRVLERVSVARPMELSFVRHNHVQASAKILPFAGRPDVQRAQIEQFLKLQQDEAQWTPERLRRKQFNLQQMDLQREAYLYHHIGMQLQTLHDEIMAGGQWQAYEFEKALWYYHAPTNALFAEHPMRNSEKTRQLIGSVQLRTRVAAQRLQHGARRFLRVAAITRRVLDAVIDHESSALWRKALDVVWQQSLQPFYVANFLRLQRRRDGIDAEAEELWERWLARDPAEQAPVEAAAMELSCQTEASFDHWAGDPLSSDQLETSAEQGAADREAGDEADGDDDEDDDDDDANWRSRLRLLKLRHKRLSPSKVPPANNNRRKTSSLVAPEPAAGLLAPGLSASVDVHHTQTWESSPLTN